MRPRAHCKYIDAPEGDVEQKENEVLVVGKAHAVGHPGAVVVHAQHAPAHSSASEASEACACTAPAAHGAVVRARWLRLLALVAPVVVQQLLLLAVATLLPQASALCAAHVVWRRVR